MSVISSEIDCFARTCVVIEYNGVGIYCRCRGMWLPARLMLFFGPLGEGAMRLPTADVAASPGEQA